ncbi:MAG: hypothetical protein LBV04_04210 [Deferribacteraceae bacterium]|jgi:hypothetical protein|nr:hypothetical protein [Deferribacteraceae bacterium]
MNYEKHKVLFIVKTYPSPSKTYDELVCTIAVTEDGRLIRIYPVPFRYMDKNKQFKKYEWTNLKIVKSDSDQRRESYKVDYDSIEPSGILVKHWPQRMELVKPFLYSSLAELNKKGMSLGIIKPSKIYDLTYEEDDEEWQEKQALQLFQQNIDDILNERDKIPLTKIPYRFRYHFSDGEEHHIVIRDWELFALFLRYYKKEGKVKAAEIVKDKFLNEICNEKNDVYFIVGTQHRFKTWLILGVMYPPKGIPMLSIEDFL